MADFTVRSDGVNVEQIMEQIRARIREKRGVDYTDAQIQELASAKLEKFLDPRGVRSDLLEQYRKAQPPFAPPELPNYAFEAETIYESTRGPLRWIRQLLRPILKLFFNPNPLIQALHIQSRLNASAAEREAKRDAARYAFDQLHYEVMHNLVLETTRLGIEVKNLKMKIESLGSRLEFNERRARALESVVVYKPAGDDRPARSDEPRRDEPRRDESRRDEPRRDDSRRQDRRPDNRQDQRQQPRPEPPRPEPMPPASPAPAADVAPPAAADVTAEGSQPAAAAGEGPGTRSRRRRRRRGRRGSGSAAAMMTAGTVPPESAQNGAPVDAPDDFDEGDDDATEGSQPETSAPEPDLKVRNYDQADTEAGDSRAVRPELFEHAFGAQAHPAEPATAERTQADETRPQPSAPNDPGADTAQQAPSVPPVTPEQ